jgi:hypothetical protein
VSRRKPPRRSVKPKPPRSFTDQLLHLFVVETIESVLEMTVPFGEDTCADLRDRELPVAEYLKAMKTEIAEHHVSTWFGSVVLLSYLFLTLMPLKLQVSFLAFYLPNFHEQSPLGIGVEVACVFAWGYLSAALAYIVVPQRESKAITVCVAWLLVGEVMRPLHGLPILWPLDAGLFVGLFAGGRTIRLFQQIARR